MEDSNVRDLLSKSTDLLKSLRHGTNSEQFLQLAQDIKNTANDLVSRGSSHHALNEQIKNVKSRMDVNKELLKTAVSNVSIIRSKISSEKPTNMFTDFDNLKDVNKHNIDAKLNDANKKIQAVMKDLRSRAKGCKKLEDMIQDYSDAMKETSDLFKNVPKILKSGKMPEDERRELSRSDGNTQSVAEEDDRRAEELLRKMSVLRLTRPVEEVKAKPQKKEDETGLPSWLEYEGFNTKEELERFKTLYRNMTGEDPDEGNSENETELDKYSETDDLEFLEKTFKELVEDYEKYKK